MFNSSPVAVTSVDPNLRPLVEALWLVIVTSSLVRVMSPVVDAGVTPADMSMFLSFAVLRVMDSELSIAHDPVTFTSNPPPVVRVVDPPLSIVVAPAMFTSNTSAVIST